MNDEFPLVTITSTDTPPGSPPLRSEVSRLREERDALAKRVEELEGAMHQRDKGIKDLCMLCRNKNMSNEDRREHAQRLALAAGFQPSITRAELEGEGGDD